MKKIVSLLIATFALAQAPAKPEFEVASVRPSAESSDGVQVGVHQDGQLVRINFLSLQDYIARAYAVQKYQVIGPDWLSSARFDISAKLPEGGTREQIPAMLQTLLAERFHLKHHRDTKEFPVYALTVAKGGAKITPVPSDGAESPDNVDVNLKSNGVRGGQSADFGNGSSYTFANAEFDAKKLTMRYLADTLTRFMDRPVVDSTELKGRYDFTLKLEADDYVAMFVQAGINGGRTMTPQAMAARDRATLRSLYESLDHLGLKLESRKAPLPVLVIDGIDKSPGGN